MKKTITTETVNPVAASERYAILDAIRGMALLGICMANFPEFSLYSFQPQTVADAYPTAAIDRVIHFLMYIFIDGKFYSLFSLLFGIGFAIIITNTLRKGVSGLKIFYRRMTFLALIGFMHLLLLWAGDILMLYALAGMLLPLFRNASDRKLLITATVMLLIPIVLDAFKSLSGIDFAAPAINATQHFHDRYGITNDNFHVWLRDADTYSEMMKFQIPGSFIRLREFIDGHRIFKVLGLFLIGFYIGRNRFYVALDKHHNVLKNICLWGFAVGLPFSLLYSWSAMHGNPLGLVLHSIFYVISIYPMALAYAAVLCLIYIKNKNLIIYRLPAYAGRMALTNYILQSVFGIIIYYGMFLALGTSMGLIYVELIAVGVFAVEIIMSSLWLKFFRFGLLEWLWRMLTYGKFLKITK
ncbi:MAG: DUF418 domain-containing protein [Tannerella sp.]|jgi:uncharacterized protein|nr:DUF418 domain-containing protein [Tannerella sp.]